MLRTILSSLMVLLIAVSTPGCKKLDKALSEVDLSRLSGSKNQRLDQGTIQSGLKEALRIGAERAASSTSALDGYMGNQLIRIGTPKELAKTTKALRKIGLDKEVDQFELAMNRSAEKSAAKARDVFWQVIQQLTIQDVMKIWKGGNQAATQYFRQKTEAKLYARFQPIVKRKMNEAGLYRHYNRMLDKYMKIPFVKKPKFDLDHYVTEKTLDGLFTVLGQEEAKIRNNPVARTTELLKKVFG